MGLEEAAGSRGSAAEPMQDKRRARRAHCVERRVRGSTAVAFSSEWWYVVWRWLS